jgi:DNA replication and repair protein RecF
LISLSSSPWAICLRVSERNKIYAKFGLKDEDNNLHFQSIALTHFRNYSELELSLHPKVNCFVGLNGEGKTNLLESIYALATTRPFVRDNFALLHGHNHYIVKGALAQHNLTNLQLHLAYVKGTGKKLLVDQCPIEKLSTHYGTIPIVTVMPNDVELVNEGPQFRREWMDKVIGQYNPAYLQATILYQKALAQRNALLKQHKHWSNQLLVELKAWEPLLIQHGLLIQQGRLEFIHNFQPVFSAYYQRISVSKESATFAYCPSIQENSAAFWENEYLRSSKNDIRLARTTKGTHGDELVFKLNNHPAKQVCSQGQLKSIVLALKFAVYDYLKQEKAIYPILLLDDLFDRLDRGRVEQIIQIVQERFHGQTFITHTSLSMMQSVVESYAKDAVQFVHIDQGSAAILD